MNAPLSPWHIAALACAVADTPVYDKCMSPPTAPVSRRQFVAELLAAPEAVANCDGDILEMEGYVQECIAAAKRYPRVPPYGAVRLLAAAGLYLDRRRDDAPNHATGMVWTLTGALVAQLPGVDSPLTEAATRAPNINPRLN